MKIIISLFAIATLFVNVAYGQRRAFEDRQFLDAIMQELNQDEWVMEEAEAAQAEAEESQDYTLSVIDAEDEVAQIMLMTEDENDEEIREASLMALADIQEEDSLDEVEYYDETLDPDTDR